MKKLIVIAASLTAGVLATTSPAHGEAPSAPLTFGQCIADGVVSPGDLYVGPGTTVNGTEHHPMADEPRGTHWEYFAAC